MRCPTCLTDVMGLSHVRELASELSLLTILKRNMSTQALIQMKGDNAEALNRQHDVRDEFYKKPRELAMHKTLFYECNRCHQAFFGGYSDCSMERVAQMAGEQELCCRNCKMEELGLREKYFCPKHALQHVQFKCDLCCSIATYHGAGNTYLCSACYECPSRDNKFNCKGNTYKCPLMMNHEAIGQRSVPIDKCVLCRSETDRVAPPTFKTHAEIHLERTLKQVDGQLRSIVSAKRKARELSSSARRTQQFLASTSSSSSLSARSNRSRAAN